MYSIIPCVILIFGFTYSLIAQSNPPVNEKPSYDRLIELTDYLSNSRVFSVTASKKGKIFYDYLAPSLKGDEAHYLMSATKSVLAVCTAIAIEDKKIPSFQTTLGDIFPNEAFSSEEFESDQKKLTIEQIFMMSGIKFPHVLNLEDLEDDVRERWNKFMDPETARFIEVLKEPTVKSPGITFNYNDHNAALAGAILQYATSENAEAYCEKILFKPMGFKNIEWMHPDPSGFVMGGYGLRLRPIDLHNLGLMLVAGGTWKGKKILSKESIATIWNRKITTGNWDWKNYGYFFWHQYPEAPWGERIEANGWKGQRLFIYPEFGLVVTITSWLEENENDVTEKILKEYILKSLTTSTGSKSEMDLILAIRASKKMKPFWNVEDMEERMVPTKQRKGPPIPHLVK